MLAWIGRLFFGRDPEPIVFSSTRSPERLWIELEKVTSRSIWSWSSGPKLLRRHDNFEIWFHSFGQRGGPLRTLKGSVSRERGKTIVRGVYSVRTLPVAMFSLLFLFSIAVGFSEMFTPGRSRGFLLLPIVLFVFGRLNVFLDLGDLVKIKALFLDMGAKEVLLKSKKRKGAQ